MYTYVYVKKEINMRRRKKSLSKGSRPKKLVFLAYKFVKGSKNYISLIMSVKAWWGG